MNRREFWGWVLLLTGVYVYVDCEKFALKVVGAWIATAVMKRQMRILLVPTYSLVLNYGIALTYSMLNTALKRLGFMEVFYTIRVFSPSLYNVCMLNNSNIHPLKNSL